MFPEETHVKILKRIDNLEADAFRLYRAAERLRLDLQRQWRVMPSGERWTEARQEESELAPPQPNLAARVNFCALGGSEPSL